MACCPRRDCPLNWVELSFPGPCLLTPTRVDVSGEAKNPGPQTNLHSFFTAAPAHPSSDSLRTVPALPSDSSTVSLAVINPTAILGKEDLVASLQADVIFASETSAVAQVQHLSSAKFKQLGFACVWGQPVPAHTSSKTGLDTKRGHAAGVALFSRLPLHRPPVAIAAELDGTLRFTEAVLRLGGMQVRLIGLYGFPANYRDAKQRNQDLLMHALKRVAQSRVPTLIGGDLNCKVQALPCWEHFGFLGYQELFDLHQRRLGQTLPPTCKNSSRHDTLLIPPTLQHTFLRAQVLSKCKAFDSHDPLIATFAAQPPVIPLTWHMPRSWAPLTPDMDKAQMHYCSLRSGVEQAIDSAKTSDDASRAFWSQTVEQSIHLAIVDAHAEDPLLQPAKGLPQSSRGRCAARRRQPLPQPHVSRKARQGDYDPTVEAASIAARRRVRQVRRIQSLYSRQKQLEQAGIHLDSATATQIQNEWRAILRCKSFGPPFQSWLLSMDCFPVIWQRSPPAEWLFLVLQVARFACEAFVKAEATWRRNRFEYLVQLDISSGSSRKGFHSMCPRARPPISCIPTLEQRTAHLWSKIDHKSGWYSTHHVQFLRAPAGVVSGDSEAFLEEVRIGDDDVDRPDLVRLSFQGEPPTTLQFCQHTQAVSPEELHREFNQFWVNIWWRDSRLEERDVSCWPSFQHLLPDPPQVLHS